MPEDDTDPAVEFDDAPTQLDAVPLEVTDPTPTPTVDPIVLPGSEIGKRAGIAMGYNAAIADMRAILEPGGVTRQKVDQLADMMRQRARAVPER